MSGGPARDRVVHDMRTYEADKARLIGGLTGHVLEIGAGTGANRSRLAPHVRWTGLEPNRRRRESCERRGGVVLDATAEAVPLPDRSVDAVLATIVLCSVRDQDGALAEVFRVLRPGGRFVFFEHVAAPAGTWTRRLQRLAAPVSRVVDHGCDPSRETWAALERAPFQSLDLRWYSRRRTRFIGGVAQA